MIPKFPVDRIQGQTLWTGELPKPYMDTLKDGKYYVVIYPVPDWTTDQQRKYFHGPVRDFVMKLFKGNGYVTTKGQIKEDFKCMFGRHKDVQTLQGKKNEPVSTSEYTKADYTELLDGINSYIQEKFHQPLPPPDSVE